MITLATSIAAKNLEIQQHAINSWRRLGFKVISINSEPEIDIVKDHFTGVEFITVDRSACELTGKPLVYLDDMFKALMNCGSVVSGIINSDIHLRVNDYFIEYLLGNTDRSVVFGSRIDIESLQDFNGIEYVKGFDFFFFDTDIIKHYPETEFCLGMPWWDYWVPILPLLRGFSVKQLISPIAFHVRHPLKWDEKYFEYLGCKFLDYLKNEQLSAKNDEFFSLIQDKVRYDNYAVGICILIYLHNEVDKIVYQLPDKNDAISTIFNYYKMRQGKLDEMLIDNMNALMSYKDSIGWKITAALRWIRNSIKQSVHKNNHLSL